MLSGRFLKTVMSGIGTLLPDGNDSQLFFVKGGFGADRMAADGK
jgi:hypothetical protein